MAQQTDSKIGVVAIPSEAEILAAKLADATVPGYEVECTPHEAERLGAFAEDALSEDDAKDSVIDGESAV
jgi:hypothetical protein